MSQEQLKQITQEDFDLALKDHFLFQKGDEKRRMKFENTDFSGISLLNNDLSGAIFDGSDFRNASTYYSGENGRGVFSSCNLTNVSFKNCRLDNIDFTSAQSMMGAILIEASFKPNSLGQFKDHVIVTEPQMEQLSQQAFEQKSIILEQENKIQNKDQKLELVSEKQSKGMLDIFKDLQKDFLREEILWLFFSGLLTFFLVTLFSFSISRFSLDLAWVIIIGFELVMVGFLYLLGSLDPKSSTDNKGTRGQFSIRKLIINILLGALLGVVAFACTMKIQNTLKEFKDIPFCHNAQNNFSGATLLHKNIDNGKGLSCIQKDEYILVFTPLILLLVSLFWFSIHQYGRAKKLRIEQQNKQAMIHLMQVVTANDGKLSKENQIFPVLAPFFANAIIHRPFSQENYDPQLPIDEVKKIIDMATLLKK